MMVQKSTAPDASLDGLLQQFKQIGFTEYEARVYIQLLRQSPATAYEIAKACGVPRPNTYNALESLSKRGSVQPVSENPMRYVATPADRHLNAIVRQTVSLCDTLAQELARLETPEDDPYVWNVQGETAIGRKIDELIGDATHTIWIKASSEFLSDHSDALRDAAARGVHMLIVIFGSDPDEFCFSPNCRVYLHENTGVRMGTADNLFTLTFDMAQVLTAATDNLTAFYTRNHAVVQMANTLIRHDFYMAEISAKFGPQIDEAFGPHLRNLRLNSFTEAQIASFRQMTGVP
ncbi:MAG: helix-turn-helix domain-containing protein [Roseovarius sp.]